MAEHEQRGTNAADSAPGVGDGPARNAAPRRFTQARGRMAVWIGIAVVLVLLVLAFIYQPDPESRPAVIPEPDRMGGVETVIPYEGQEPKQ